MQTHSRFCDLHFALARRILQSSPTRRHCNKEPMPMTILPNLQQENEALRAKLADMQALLVAASKPKALTLKVSEKGAISVYGLGRFPITLYRGQMERLLGHSDVIRTFIASNASLLATKD
jgi:hypothetical protein